MKKKRIEIRCNYLQLPNYIMIALTKNQVKSLDKLFQYARQQNSLGKPGIILAQPLQSEDENILRAGFVENSPALKIRKVIDDARISGEAT